MRILFVLHQWMPEFQGGTERVALNLARSAQRAGHRVDVMACYLDRGAHEPVRVSPALAMLDAPPALRNEAGDVAGVLRTMVDGVPAWVLDRSALPARADHALDVDDMLADGLAGWMREQHIDVVHVLHTMRTATVAAAAQRAQCPIVMTLTDFFAPCYRVNLVDESGVLCDGPDGGSACARRCPSAAWTTQALRERYEHARELLTYASARVTPSPWVANRLSQAFDGQVFDVIPHGVDLLRWSPTAKRSAQGVVLHLGYLGTLNRAKGLQVLLQALAQLQGLPIRLTIAGAMHGVPDYEAQIRQLIAEDARVQWLGSLTQDALRGVVDQLDLLCLPSLVPETYSLVLQECAAAGVPALVSDLGAPAEQVRLTGAGAAVPAGNAAAWAAALAEWAADPELRQHWRQRVALPMRVEEEAFLYDGIFRRAVA